MAPIGSCEISASPSNSGVMSGVDADFAVAVGISRLRGAEETAGTRGGEPSGNEQRRPIGAARRGVEQLLQPATHVTQLRRAPAEQREHRAGALGRAQKVSDRMTPLRER